MGAWERITGAADHVTNDRLAEEIEAVGGHLGGVLLAIAQRAMGDRPAEATAKGVPDPDEAAKAEAGRADEMAELRRQLAELQGQGAEHGSG